MRNDNERTRRQFVGRRFFTESPKILHIFLSPRTKKSKKTLVIYRFFLETRTTIHNKFFEGGPKNVIGHYLGCRSPWSFINFWAVHLSPGNRLLSATLSLFRLLYYWRLMVLYVLAWRNLYRYAIIIVVKFHGNFPQTEKNDAASIYLPCNISSHD